MLRIACLHTADSNIAVFETALADLGLGDGVTLSHHVRADLFDDAERAGGLTQDIQRRTTEALNALTADADAVLLTCSTLGPTVMTGGAIVRTDAALAETAVRGGGQVVVLCAAETTLGPTRDLFGEVARGTDARVEVRLVSGAWARFRAGDHGGYLQLIADAAEEALRQGATTVALAQASMAGALKLMENRPVLASPAAGLKAAVEVGSGRV